MSADIPAEQEKVQRDLERAQASVDRLRALIVDLTLDRPLRGDLADRVSAVIDQQRMPDCNCPSMDDVCRNRVGTKPPCPVHDTPEALARLADVIVPAISGPYEFAPPMDAQAPPVEIMAEAWRCDACEYVHPGSVTPERCPACDVGPFGSWTGAQVAGDRLKSEADEARIMSLTQENKRLREAACVIQTDIQITEAMVDRAARCSFAQDAESARHQVGWFGAPSDVRDDYREHVRAVLAAAFDDGETAA